MRKQEKQLFWKSRCASQARVLLKVSGPRQERPRVLELGSTEVDQAGSFCFNLFDMSRITQAFVIMLLTAHWPWDGPELWP
jgi:hypothetical protein